MSIKNVNVKSWNTWFLPTLSQCLVVLLFVFVLKQSHCYIALSTLELAVKTSLAWKLQRCT